MSDWKWWFHSLKGQHPVHQLMILETCWYIEAAPYLQKPPGFDPPRDRKTPPMPMAQPASLKFWQNPSAGRKNPSPIHQAIHQITWQFLQHQKINWIHQPTNPISWKFPIILRLTFTYVSWLLPSCKNGQVWWFAVVTWTKFRPINSVVLRG